MGFERDVMRSMRSRRRRRRNIAESVARAARIEERNCKMWEEALIALREGTFEVMTERATPKFEPRPRQKRPGRAMCPETAPILDVRLGTRGYHVLRYADEATPESHARPVGANALLLFTAISRDGNALRSNAELFRKVTRSPYIIDLPEEFDGLYMTYWARWSGPRSEIGPWSEPVSLLITT